MAAKVPLPAATGVAVGEGVAKPTFSLLIPAAFFSGVLSISPPVLFLLFLFLPFGILVGRIGPIGRSGRHKV